MLHTYKNPQTHILLYIFSCNLKFVVLIAYINMLSTVQDNSYLLIIFSHSEDKLYSRGNSNIINFIPVFF